MTFKARFTDYQCCHPFKFTCGKIWKYFIICYIVSPSKLSLLVQSANSWIKTYVLCYILRGSLRKFLDTHQLSTIIEILPLHFIKLLSLSIYATSHPPEPRLEALAPVTVISAQDSPWYTATTPSGVENHFPGSRAFTTGNRKGVPGLDCKEDGSTATQNSPSENPLSNGWHGHRHFHCATECPSVQLLGTFLTISGEPVGGQLWCTTVQSLFFDAQVVATWPPAAKKVSTIFFPTLFALFTLRGQSSLGNTQTDEWCFVSEWHW